jgi:hypothetical protein
VLVWGLAARPDRGAASILSAYLPIYRAAIGRYM